MSDKSTKNMQSPGNRDAKLGRKSETNLKYRGGRGLSAGKDAAGEIKSGKIGFLE